MGDEKPQQRVPEKSTLQTTVERTASERDEVTLRLLPQLIASGKSSRKFIEDACTFAGITPPNPSDKLASFVYKLQKDVCKFPETDSPEGRDGKLGPNTFNALLAKIPQLIVFSKQTRRAPFSASRRNLAASIGAPSPSQPQPQVAPEQVASQVETTKLKPQDVLTIGDSLTYGFARPFYKGTSKYREYNRTFFESGRSIFKMRGFLQNNLDLVKRMKGFTIWGGANDIFYQRPEKINSEIQKIIELIVSVNPNAKIVLCTLHGKDYKHYRKKAERTRGKLNTCNGLLRETARKYSKNVKLVDTQGLIDEAQAQGNRVLSSDKLHLTPKGYKALGRLMQDEFENNRHGRLTEYMA